MNARRWDDVPSPLLAALDAMECTHGVPDPRRGRTARHCPLCRRIHEARVTGQPVPRYVDTALPEEDER